MKIQTGLPGICGLGALLFNSFLAQAGQRPLGPKDSFDCQNLIPGYSTPIAMTVQPDGTGYTATLQGSTITGPQPAVRVLASPKASLQMPGVSDILRVVALTSNEWASVTQVVVFTTGNFDDDAAGVRGASFLDASERVLGSGMFFGWAGAYVCR